jgi:hypothetical protein
MHSRAGEHWGVQHSKNYVERTGTVLVGWCDQIPEMESWSARLSEACFDIAAFDNIEFWTVESRVEISVALLNMLHNMARCFEIHAQLIRCQEGFEYRMIVDADINLDSLQSTCGHPYGPNSGFFTSERLTRYIDSRTGPNAQIYQYTALNSDVLERLEFIYQEQWGVLKAANKYSERTSNNVERPSMRDWLVERFKIIIRLTRMFSERCESLLRLRYKDIWEKLDEGESNMQETILILTPQPVEEDIFEDVDLEMCSTDQ